MAEHLLPCQWGNIDSRVRGRRDGSVDEAAAARARVCVGTLPLQIKEAATAGSRKLTALGIVDAMLSEVVAAGIADADQVTQQKAEINTIDCTAFPPTHCPRAQAAQAYLLKLTTLDDKGGI